MRAMKESDFVPGANFHELQIIYKYILYGSIYPTQLPYNPTYKYTYNLHHNAVALVGGGYFCTIRAANLTRHKT